MLLYIFLTSGVKLHIHLLNVVVQFIVLLTLSTLICRGTDISKCFSESLVIRDNESRLYVVYMGVDNMDSEDADNEVQISLLTAQSDESLCRPLKHRYSGQKCKPVWGFLASFGRILRCSGYIVYSRLSLSRIPRDCLKYFEISVLRHIRFAELRKN